MAVAMEANFMACLGDHSTFFWKSLQAVTGDLNDNEFDVESVVRES